MGSESNHHHHPSLRVFNVKLKYLNSPTAVRDLTLMRREHIDPLSPQPAGTMSHCQG